MDWIFDHFQIVVLVAIGVVSVVKSMLEAKAREKQQREEEYEPGDVFAPDEEYRLPETFPVPPPLRESGYDEASAIESAKALKHQRELADRLRKMRETKATTTGGAAATRDRVSGKHAGTAAGDKGSDIRSRLRDPKEVRRAFVLREILAPPVGLR